MWLWMSTIAVAPVRRAVTTSMTKVGSAAVHLHSSRPPNQWEAGRALWPDYRSWTLSPQESIETNLRTEGSPLLSTSSTTSERIGVLHLVYGFTCNTENHRPACNSDRKSTRLNSSHLGI